MADATLFSRTVDILKPGATGRDIVELLGGRAKRTTALDWRSGRREAPRWALEMLSAKLNAHVQLLEGIADEIQRAPERIGKRAGAINLALYRARHS